MQKHHPADNPVADTCGVSLAESVAGPDGQSTQLTAMQHILTSHQQRCCSFAVRQDLQFCRGVMIELVLRRTSHLPAINR